MKKIVLSLDALQVESFETAAGRPARGTVRGRDAVDDEVGAASNDISCETCQTCDDSQCDSCWFNTCTCHVLCNGGDA
ncbi:MAG: pinensin family lanthipeptide [Longimicrobiaceae bacterium]|jgi:hypothetical protein